jgi:hypothetical protein
MGGTGGEVYGEMPEFFREIPDVFGVQPSGWPIFRYSLKAELQTESIQ